MSNHNKSESGFTLIEMLIVAPIVILMIGIFISSIVAMTGDVLSTRTGASLSYKIQDALDTIEDDVNASGSLLSANDILLTSPQGYDDSTGGFNNASETYGDMLIIKSYATTGIPTSALTNIMYLSNQPYACTSDQIGQNLPMMLNIIYFVKDETLWRRVVVPSNYTTAGCATVGVGGAVGLPWQQPSCSPGIINAFCKAEDIKLVDGIKAEGFTVKYYESSNSTAENTIASDGDQSTAARQAAISTTTAIGVTIRSETVTAGRDINQSGVIRASSKNNVVPINRRSCASIYETGGSIGDGTYSINPTGTVSYQAYCDMQNGGWTRLNNNLATSTTSFNASDVISRANVPGGCGTPGCAFTINNIKLDYDRVKVLLTRTSTVVHCADITNQAAIKEYWNGSAWISGNMCVWSDGIYANSTITNMAGLRLLWKMEGEKSGQEIKFTSQCSDSTDNGTINVTAWVK